MAKFTIDTKDGLKQVEAIPFRFKSPAWLRPFRFITHLTDNDLPEPGYTVTDIKTGRSVASGCDSRKEAKKACHERLIVAGRAAFLARRREFAIGHNNQAQTPPP